MKLREILSANCPKCYGDKSLRKVLFGLPSELPDESKYVLGGCCPPDVETDIQCVKCGWEGNSDSDLRT